MTKILAVLVAFEIVFTGVVAWRYVGCRRAEDPAMRLVTCAAIVTWFAWSVVAFGWLAISLWRVP